MNNLSLEELKAIIETGDFEALVNRIENEFCECKRGIYLLEDDFGKRELAKDVTSFANLNGGYILIGPQTERNEKHLGDEIKAISYLQEGQINFKQYYDIIREWVYPDTHGLNIYWQASKSDKGKGIFVISIPEQGQELKPFLIKKILDEKKKVEIIFGYVERKRDNNAPKDIASIHSLLRDGISYSKNIDGRLLNLELLLAEFKKKESSVKKKEIYQGVQERVMKALTDNKMNHLPNFSLIVYPGEPAELKTIFLDTENSIKRKLENPPVLRYHGWDLETSDRAEIKEGKLIRVKIEGVKLIDLYEDGEMVFCVLANDDFLSWGRNTGTFKFNILALIESISNFVIFYGEVLKDFRYAVENVYFCFAFNNLWIDQNKYFLVPYPVGSMGYRYGDDKKEAPQHSVFSSLVLTKINNFKAEVVTHELISKIFVWFGITLDKIPYTKIENGVTVIDLETIKGVR